MKSHRQLSRVSFAALVVVISLELTVRVLAGSLPPSPDLFPPEASHKLAIVEERLAELAGGMVVLGSSVADAGIDPSAWTDTTGQPAYNAALSAGSLHMIEVFARSEFVPRLEPSVVLITVSSRDLNANDRLQNRIEQEWLESPEAERILGTESTLDRVDRRLAGLSALWEHRRTLRSPRAWWGDAPPPWEPGRNLNDGQLADFRNGALGELDERAERFFCTQVLWNWAVSPARVGALERLVEWLQLDGRTVVLVDVPVSTSYLALHPDPVADPAEYVATIDEVAARTGVHLVRPGVWEAEWFADPIHLNADGAGRLTALVVDAVGHR